MFPELLQTTLAGVVELSATQIQALEAHYQLMVRWNRTLNLTSIRTEAEAVERHYAEALFLGAHLPAGSLSIADVGSGAGFPGFPVAILRADCQVMLIESHQRKSVFLREASRGISNLKVLGQRAEDVKLEGGFDVVVSRAVSYRDLGASLGKLAPVAALLTGAEEPPAELGFQWDVPISLPWGSNRFVRIGRRLG